MKYGLMYYKSTDNIGDDIQTYVAIKYLPHIDYYIDRESLSCFVPKEKEYVSMIMNGWYIHNKIAWPPSPYINPLLISMHFRNLKEVDIGDEYLKGFGGEFLKQYEPVGARDIETEKRLKQNGIETYFSGCMTLTLDKFKNTEKKEKICLVDVGEEVIKKVGQSTNCNIEILSHFLDQKETEKKAISQRMKEVENLLKKYQEAKLIITNRLHVALPSVALGTPVILLHKEFYDEDRLGNFLDLFDNYIDNEFLEMDITELLKSPKPNSSKYLKIRENIDKKCKEFIQKCENFSFANEDLPDIEDYKKYVNNIKWYKNIYEQERLSLENLESKRIKEFNIYHRELDILNNALSEARAEVQKYQNQNIKLNQELSQIYNSKGWKYLERLRKFL